MDQVAPIFGLFKLLVTLYLAYVVLKFIWRAARRYYLDEMCHCLRDRVVLITGATSGLGKALAHEFYNSGCKLILTGRDQKKLDQLQNELEALKVNNNPIKLIKMDLTNSQSIQDAAREAVDVYDRIDYLVNNAGISYRGRAAATEIHCFRKVMEINFFGQVALTRAIVAHMEMRDSGHIVFINSLQGAIAIPYRSAYASAKHALNAYCDSLRAELSNTNLHVLNVYPMYIRTNLSMNAITEDGQQHNRMDENTKCGAEPSAIATQVKNAILEDKYELWPSFVKSRLVIVLRVLFSDLYHTYMAIRANQQRDEMERVL